MDKRADAQSSQREGVESHNSRMERRRSQQIAARLKKAYGAQRVLLFGSIARDQQGPDSDVDLFVIRGFRYRL